MLLAPKRPIAKKGCCEGTTTIGVDEEQELPGLCSFATLCGHGAWEHFAHRVRPGVGV